MSEKLFDSPKFRRGLGAFFLGTSAIFGALAYEANNNAVQAETKAELYESEGHHDLAQNFENEANNHRYERNVYVPVAISEACFALVAFGAAANQANSRREEAES